MPSDRPPASNEAATTLRAALDVLVLAPLGLGAKLVDDAPEAMERARQELSNARFIGRLTVTQGVAQVRSNLEATRERSSAAPPLDVEEAVLPEDLGTDGPTVEELALPDYEHLPAIDIVAKLPQLSVAERDAIERYEAAHRQRRTVLGKLEQLADTL